MQQEYNEAGEEGFPFEILDYLKPKDDLNYDYTKELKLLEEMWLEKLQPYKKKGLSNDIHYRITVQKKVYILCFRRERFSKEEGKFTCASYKRHAKTKRRS